MTDYAACDEMVLTYRAPGEPPRIRWVQFVYGNDDGTTVICDYTVNLESALLGAEAFAARLAE